MFTLVLLLRLWKPDDDPANSNRNIFPLLPYLNEYNNKERLKSFEKKELAATWIKTQDLSVKMSNSPYHYATTIGPDHIITILV